MTTSDIKRLRELAGKVAHAEKMAKEKLSDAIEVNRSLARAQFANALIEAAPALLAAYEDAERYRLWRKTYAEGPTHADLLVEIALAEGEKEIDAAIDAAMGDKP